MSPSSLVSFLETTSCQQQLPERPHVEKLVTCKLPCSSVVGPLWSLNIFGVFQVWEEARVLWLQPWLSWRFCLSVSCLFSVCGAKGNPVSASIGGWTTVTVAVTTSALLQSLQSTFPSFIFTATFHHHCDCGGLFCHFYLFNDTICVE